MNDSTPLPGTVPEAPKKEPDAADRLRQLWLQGQRPDIVEFLASCAPLALAQVAAVLRVDQGYRWQSGERIAAETYLRQHPEVAAHAESALDLVYGEYLLRERNGEDASLNDLLSRFPEHAAVLSMQVELHQAIALLSASPHKPEAPAKDPRVAFAGASGLYAADALPSGGSADPQPTQEGSAGQSSETAPTLPRYPNATEVASSPGLPVLAGYHILAEIGRGGMSVVYQARQKGLNRKVALKMLLAGSYAGPEERARFHTEAEALGRFQHPHIVPVYEVGEQDGRPYLVMEYIEGSNLARHLLGTPLTARQAAQLVEQLARAIHFAHQRRIVHRDLKPANILLVSDGVVSGEEGAAKNPSGPLTTNHSPHTNPKITDFGLAKLLVGEPGVSNPGGQTQSGTILGTPSYMAPEQAAGASRDIGPAADIYALGAILYELLTGRPPFRAATPLETLLQVQTDEPVPPSRLCPRLPRDIATICLKCLEKEPRKRYGSAEALAQDLGHFLAGEPIQARPVGTIGRTWRWCRRKPALASMIAAVGLMAAVITTISVVSALWLGAEARRARRAEREAIEKLLTTTLAQAQALRHTGQMGQRFQSLKKLREATRIARSLDLLDQHTLELRNEVIASLALVDLDPIVEYPIPGRWDWPYDCPVAFDARLERYACCDQQGNILIRQVAGHRDVARLPGRLSNSATKALLAALRFSPDGRFLAAGYWLDGRAVRFVLWKLPRGQARRPAQEVFHIADAGFFTFSADSSLLAIAMPDSSLRLYDLVRNKTQDLGPGFVATQMVFGPDSRQLAFVNHVHQDKVQILDVETGKVIKSLAHPAEIHVLAWSADGRLLTAGCDDRNAYVWDTGEWRQQAVLEGHQKRGMTALAFSPVRTLLASSNRDGTTRLWDPVSGRQLVKATCKLLQFGADGRRLAFQRGRHIGIWEVADGRECRLLHHGRFGNRTPWTDTIGPDCLDFHPNGRLLISAGGDGVRLWDLGTCREIAYLNIGHHEAVVFHPDGSRFYTHGRTGLRCWPIRAELRREAAGPAKPGYRIGPPQAMEVRAGRGQFRLCCSADGRRLAVSDFDHDRAMVLQPDRPGAKIVLDDTPDLHSLALSPDGRWVAAGPARPGDAIKVWDLRSGRLVWRSPLPNGFLLFSPDSRWLVGGGQQDCRLWRTGSWEPGPIFPRDGRWIWNGPLAFSRDGRLLAAPRSLQHVQLLDFAGRREVATLAAPDLPSLSWLCFSPDGSRLAAATESHTIQLWDLRAIGRTLETMGLGSPLLPALPDQPASAPAPRVRVWQELYEGETLQVVSADCHHFDQEMSFFGREHWSSGRQRMCLPKKGGHVEFLVTVPETTRYALTVSLTRAWDFGMVELAIDGKKVGKVFDGFRPGFVPPTRVDYGTVPLREGSHRFRFTAVDKNPKSVNFYMGIDCLTLTAIK